MWDFQYDLELLQPLLRDANVDIARIGDRTGTAGIIRKNFLAAWEETHALESWDEPIVRLVEKLGGLQQIRHVLGLLSAERAWLQIDLPSVGSPYSESNRISANLLHEITSLGLGFGVEVFSFDAGEKTHHPFELPNQIPGA
jgi:hypothetical protein